ncbi:MAG: hypothetical protein ABIO70_12245 [Pseudomonadota bacterium]
MRTLPLLLLFTGCGAHAGAGRARVASTVLPRLPAPEAQLYAVHLTAPSDPLVARAARGLPWEESLSGAAGAVGVAAAGGEPADAWTVRWAALRAGYPYPVVSMITEGTAEGAVSQAVLQALAEEVREGDHVGLARVRGADGDLWVGLVGRSSLALAPLPRALPPGGKIDVRPTSNPSKTLELSVVSPNGAIERMPLGAGRALTLDEIGEYWVQVREGPALRAAFAVSVGMEPSPVAPLRGLSLPVATGEALIDAAWSSLEAVAEEYGRQPPRADSILEPVARAHLRDRLGESQAPSGAFAGSPGSCRASLGCELKVGTGAESCVEQWLIDAGARAALLDSRCSLAGVAAERRGDRLWLQLELGQE